MARSSDARQFFGLEYLAGGEGLLSGSKPKGQSPQKKPKKSNPNISAEAERSQHMNSTNARRKAGAQ